MGLEKCTVRTVALRGPLRGGRLKMMEIFHAMPARKRS